MSNQKSFDYCALKYFNAWLSNDSETYAKLKYGTVNEQVEAIRKFATQTRVVRNFTDFALPETREKVRGSLVRLPEPDSAESAIKLVGKYSDKLSGIFGGKDYISASSKLLWLRFRSPIVIYDRRARDALGENLVEYRDFYHAWHSAFKEKQLEIAGACKRILDVRHYYFDDSISRKEAKSVIDSEWFMERVFDIYLWESGGVK